ncbi:MAG TPA: alpha-L-fucosidase [Balneolales bacterium]|nr:alpha-L-fucosidase [Balneolales bacterium]
MQNHRFYFTRIFGTFIILLLVALTDAFPQAPLSKTEHSTSQNNRMTWWRDARFGMFIHWGIYAVPAHAEWYMNNGHVPRKEYEKYAKQFDPVKFNADQWVKIAKDAGMKYMIITSKHHDGFVMFHTKTTHYNVVDDTPWGKDPLKALSKACREQGIKFGVYYSIMDWHSPYQMAHNDSVPSHPTYNPTRIRPGKKDAYKKYMMTQLKELITQYHPAVLWFDGEWPAWWTYQDGKELYGYLRNMDPKLIINNRIGKRPTGMKGIQMQHAVGDFGTPEQNIPPNGIPGTYWETCMTINNDWGYNKDDHDFKSDTTLIRNLVDIASKGGNYLLNVGPTAMGIIPQPEVTRLEEMGKWLKVNGQAIYGSSASPFKQKFGWGRVTAKPGKLYLEVFNWPEDGKLTLPSVDGHITHIRLLADPSRKGLSAKETQGRTVVALQGNAPDGIASVVELEVRK